MSSRARQFVAALAVIASAALVGCQTAAPPPLEPVQPAGPSRPEQPPIGPVSPWFYPRPTLALDAPALHKAARNAGISDNAGPVRWYETRNDARLSTFAGYRSTVVDHLYVETYENLTQHGDHVRDHYQQRTYRTRTTHTVR